MVAMLLGAPDLTSLGLDESLLAEALGAEAVSGLEVEAVDYDLDTITTAGRWWVRGTACRAGQEEPFRVVAKVLRSAAASPVWPFIPPPLRARTLELLDWRVEPAVYRSQLAEVVPVGLRLPRCLAVRDLVEDGCVVWLEAVEHEQRPWTDADLARAARVLGRFAASAAVAEVADVAGHPFGPEQARAYWDGRLRHQFGPAYAGEELWHHPAVAAHVDTRLRGRILALLDAVPGLLPEIEALPLLTGHGDACPNNLLVTGEEFVAIDWGYFSRIRLGFDLSQLVISEIELGRAPGASLPHRQDVVLPAYAAGLAEGGVRITLPELRRAHAVQLAVAAGVSMVPLEQLGDDPDRLDGVLRERMAALDQILTPLGI